MTDVAIAKHLISLLRTSEYNPLPLSAVTSSSINTREPISLAFVQSHSIMEHHFIAGTHIHFNFYEFYINKSAIEKKNV